MPNRDWAGVRMGRVRVGMRRAEGARAPEGLVGASAHWQPNDCGADHVSRAARQRGTDDPRGDPAPWRA